jgi:hypothetical protein
MSTQGALKSKLIGIGGLLILYGLFVPGPLEQYLASRFRMTLPVALLVDASKATLFVGLGVLAIGLVRERRARQKAKQTQ